MKTALITGVTGQDGAYLAELLLQKATRILQDLDVPLRSIPIALIIFIKTCMKGTFVSNCTTVI